MAALVMLNAIFRAAGYGNAGEVAKMLDTEPALLEATGSHDSRPLLYEAAQYGHTTVVKVLLGRGANIDSKNSLGWSPLYIAAMSGHEDVITMLLRAGAEISSRNGPRGRTATMGACIGDQLGALRLLMRHMSGDSLNTRDKNGCTALWWACAYGRAEVTRALLLEGADYTIADTHANSSKTPQQKAQERADNDPCVTVFEVGVLTHAGLGTTVDTDAPQRATLLTPCGYDAFATWQWWEGELQRAYALYRARRVHEDSTTQQQAPGALVPAYLTGRVERSERLPSVTLQLGADDGKRAARGSVKRSKGGKGGQPLEEEEKSATLKYVTHDLVRELYLELMEGFHK